VASGPVHFGKIPDEHWYQPSWVNETKAQEERHKMEQEGVIYGGSLSSVFEPFLLCAYLVLTACLKVPKHVPFQLGGSALPLLYRSELMHVASSSFATRCFKTSGTTGALSESCLGITHPPLAYLSAHRPNVHFHCDINFDPFVYLHENNKTYGPSRPCCIYLS
jgi:hypothetical protein